MTTNNNFKYDLEIGQQAENLLGQLLEGSRLEVKFDRYVNDKFFIEIYRIKYDSKEKELSGLAVSQADYYALCKNNIFIIIERRDLIRLVKKKLGNRKVSEIAVSGGDGGRTYGILITISEIFQFQLDIRTYRESILVNDSESEVGIE